ncbi:uncharacterized protein LOC111120706 isoform X2 [Crassostrea virginica]
MKILVVLTVFLGIGVQTTLAATCLTDAECGTDECCFRHEGPWIASRRQLTARFLVSSHAEEQEVHGPHRLPEKRQAVSSAYVKNTWRRGTIAVSSIN